jgi:TonB family protein
MEEARFRPAEWEGRPVPYTIVQPLTFNGTREYRPAAIGDTVMPRLLNPADVARALREGYPPLLRDAGVTGSAVVQFVVDESGRVVEPRVVRASHEQFGPAATRALEQARFAPATLAGSPVRKRVTQPVAFTLPRTGEGELPPISSEAVNRSLVGYVAGRVNGPEAEEMRARSAEMQRRSAEIRVRGEEMRVQGEEMRVRSEEMRARSDRTRAALRTELQARHPEILRDGLPVDRYLWIVADASERVVASGVLPIHFDSRRSWSTTSVERQLRARFPEASLDVNIFMPVLLDSARTVNAAWVTSRRGAARPAR